MAERHKSCLVAWLIFTGASILGFLLTNVLGWADRTVSYFLTLGLLLVLAAILVLRPVSSEQKGGLVGGLIMVVAVLVALLVKDVLGWPEAVSSKIGGAGFIVGLFVIIAWRPGSSKESPGGQQTPPDEATADL